MSKVCKKNLCQNGGICQEDNNDNYNCLCPSGYTGKNCEGKVFCKIL